MVQYLDIPSESELYSMDGFYSLMPSYDELDAWQQILYDKMELMVQYQLETNAIYKWVAGHSGCFWDHVFRGYRIMRAHKGKLPWTYCCGVTFELFWLFWEELMGEDFQSEIDMTLSVARELLAYWFVFVGDSSDKYKYQFGAAKGVEVLGEHLRQRWERAQLQGKVEGPFDWIDCVYHMDPYQARFGDFIQFQSQPDILKGGGHAAIFVGLEKRDGEDVVRVFNSNVRNDYGMPGGVGFGWFKINKIHKETGFKRVIHFGSIRLP